MALGTYGDEDMKWCHDRATFPTLVHREKSQPEIKIIG
jgi:hypothetical protein